MNVKTYRSGSLQGALDDIKRDLGSEALILSTREVAASRFRFLRRGRWEVAAAGPVSAPALALPEATAKMPAAAMKEEFPPIAPLLPKAESGSALSSGNASTAVAPALEKTKGTRFVHPADREFSPYPKVEPADMDEVPRRSVLVDRRIDLLLEDMDDLKRAVKSIGMTMPAANDRSGSLFGELVSQGIEPDLADKLVTSASRGNPAPGEARNRVRRLLTDMIVVDPPAELQAKGRLVSVFIGPTGVGKTTTIAKIAGQASIRLKKKVALISTDMMRVGGHEQLTRYGALLNVATHVCSDLSTLKSLIQSLDDRELILVDTPGASPSDLARLAKLEPSLALPEARVNLVVGSNTRSGDVAKILKRFQRFSPKRVIFTKLDETDSKAAIVGDLLRSEMAVSYVTNGQRVPDDLVIPSAGDLARWVLPEV